MQISLQASRPIPTDKTLYASTQKSAQLAVLLDGHRYVLVRRLGGVFERTNKDIIIIIIDLLDCWLEHNIEMFPEDEREGIMDMLQERKSGVNISHHRPQ